jgi:hypothetical protein
MQESTRESIKIRCSISSGLISANNFRTVSPRSLYLTKLQATYKSLRGCPLPERIHCFGELITKTLGVKV